jgi:hypothetical protein
MEREKFQPIGSHRNDTMAEDVFHEKFQAIAED